MLKIDSDACRLLFNDPIQTESAGILLRSRLQASSRRLGFSEGRREKLALVAAEMSSNLIKHAGGKGTIQIWQQPGSILDILSLDFGLGVNNLELAQKDGYSRTNTLGKGLGSIMRLADEFAIYTQLKRNVKPGNWHGTAILARFRLAKQPPGATPPYEISLFARAFDDDRYNGDKVYVQQRDDKLRFLHLDGLGHGEKAKMATSNLDSYVAGAADPLALIETVDRHLRTTERGAVAIAGEIDLAGKSAQIAGVGDMVVHTYQQEKLQSLSFAPGVLGREHRKPVVTQMPIAKKSILISVSDGIRRGWDAESFRGLFNQHPQLIAYVLGNIMARMTDDQSICVIRIN